MKSKPLNEKTEETKVVEPTCNETLRKICQEKLILCSIESGYHDIPIAWKSRLNQELNAIQRWYLEDYFLAVYDIAAQLRKYEILSIVSGAANSSFILHLIGLSPVNPIEYNLLFERFLPATNITSMESTISIEIPNGCLRNLGELWDSEMENSNLIPHKNQVWIKNFSKQLSVKANQNNKATNQKLDSLIIIESDRLSAIDRLLKSSQHNTGINQQPKSLSKVAVASVFHRRSHTDPEWNRRLNEAERLRQSLDYEDPINQILRESNGVIIYQEQIMMLLKEVANFDLGEAYDAFKAIVRQDAAAIRKYEERFMDRSILKVKNPAFTKSVWNQVREAAPFSLCKAHMISEAWMMNIEAYFAMSGTD